MFSRSDISERTVLCLNNCAHLQLVPTLIVSVTVPSFLHMPAFRAEGQPYLPSFHSITRELTESVHLAGSHTGHLNRTYREILIGKDDVRMQVVEFSLVYILSTVLSMVVCVCVCIHMCFAVYVLPFAIDGVICVMCAP